MQERGVRWCGKLLSMAMLLGVVAAQPMTTVAEDDGDRWFRAYVFEGTCEMIRSEPVADLGELIPDHEAGLALASDMEPTPEAVYGTEGHIGATLETLRASEHVVAVRENQDGKQPVVTCADITSDEGETDVLELTLRPFGETGLGGQVHLEPLKRVEESTKFVIGLWNAPPEESEANERQMPEAPDFELTLLDGETIHLSDYRGKTVLLIMWASWCPYCDAEFPTYEEIWRDVGDDDVVFLGVGLKNDDQDEAEAFIEEHGATFPVGRDTEGGNANRGEIESTLGVPATPALFIITPDGHVYGAQFGVIERESLEEAIEDASQYRDAE